MGASIDFSRVVSNLDSLSKSSQIQALIWHGTFQFLKGEMEDAKKVFEKARNLDPKNVEILTKLALVSLEQNSYAEMTETLEQALEADPLDPSVYYHRGEILALNGNFDSAIADFTKSIELDSRFIPAYVHKTRALLGIQMIDAAKDFVLRALQLFPENVDLTNCYGEVLASNGSIDEAAKTFDHILERNPKSPQVWLNKALLGISDPKAMEQVEECLRTALEIEPAFIQARIQLAILLLSANKPKDSLVQFDEAAKNARTLPELVIVHSQRAASLAQSEVAERYPVLAEKIRFGSS
jgi:mitochondrial import receptor subunit TOM70